MLGLSADAQQYRKIDVLLQSRLTVSSLPLNLGYPNDMGGRVILSHSTDIIISNLIVHLNESEASQISAVHLQELSFRRSC